jgi:hypothetical protein
MESSSSAIWVVGKVCKDGFSRLKVDRVWFLWVPKKTVNTQSCIAEY